MILTPLVHAQRYASLHPLFPAAFAAACDPALSTRPDGRHALNGDDLFVIIESYPTRAPAEKRLECHRRYIDLQIMLSGAEAMLATSVHGLAIAEDFAPGKDLRFFHTPARPLTRFVVEPGHGAIFFPEDAHQPGCHPDGAPVTVRKAVFKIAVAPGQAPT